MEERRGPFEEGVQETVLSTVKVYHLPFSTFRKRFHKTKSDTLLLHNSCTTDDLSL